MRRLSILVALCVSATVSANSGYVELPGYSPGPVASANQHYFIGGDDSSGNAIIESMTLGGLPEPAWGGTGFVTWDYGGSADLYNSISFGGGKMLVGGLTQVVLNGGTTICPTYAEIARYNGNGSFDTALAGVGRLRVTWGNSNPGCVQTVNDARVDANGKMVVTGGDMSSLDFWLHPVVARYLWNGTLDSTFGNVSLPITRNGDHDYPGPQGHAVGFYPNGDILVAGNNVNWWLVRLHPNGTVDTTFGNNGVVTLFGGVQFNKISPYKIVIYPNGNALVGGVTDGGNNSLCFTLAAVTPTGGLVSTYNGGAGYNSICLDQPWNADFAIDSQGRVIIGGPTATGIALYRFTAMGALDTTYGIGGGTGIYFGSVWNFPGGVAVDAKDQIVASAVYRNGSGSFVSVLARFTPTGALDTSFGF